MSTLFSITNSLDVGQFALFQTNQDVVDEITIENFKSNIKNFSPVLVEEQSFLGTISNYMNKAEFDKSLKSKEKSPLNSNIQKQDVAFLNSENDVLVIKGNIKFIDNFYRTAISDNSKKKSLYEQFINKYVNEIKLDFILNRYLLNILSGQILWRNKYGFDKRVIIEYKSLNESKKYDFHTSSIKPLDFNHQLNDDNYKELLSNMCKNLTNKEYFMLSITYFINLGYGSITFPSQEFVESDSKNKKSKHLAYQLIDSYEKQAIIHSQKIGNALRTIDDLYEKNAENAIPVEIYGALVKQSEIFRPMGKNSLFDYFSTNELEKIVNQFENYKNNHIEVLHYMMMCFLKGGLLGMNEK